MPSNNITLQTLLKAEEIDQYKALIPQGEIPLWEIYPEFVEKYLRIGRSLVTVKGVRDSLRFAIRHLNTLTIEKLNSPRFVEEGLFEYKQNHNISSNTFNSLRKNFNTFAIWLYKMEYIAENKVAKISKCAVYMDEQLTLSQQQVNAVIAHIHGRRQTRLERYRNVFFIDLLRFIGARPCELLSLKMKDVTPDGETYKVVIHGRKQKGRNRYYKFPSYLRDSFEGYLSYRQNKGRNEEKLFVSSSRRTGWTFDGLKRLMARLSNELQFKITSYSFRRYVATRLYSQEMPLRKIADYLGHTRTGTTQRYIERSCNLTKQCGNIMGEEKE